MRLIPPRGAVESQGQAYCRFLEGWGFWFSAHHCMCAYLWCASSDPSIPRVSVLKTRMTLINRGPGFS